MVLEPSCDDLEASLGYTFSAPTLRTAALRHPSAGGPDFERLEFLGDAALSLAVGIRLYVNHPDWDEGQLTKMRAALVSNDHLLEVATDIGLNAHLRISPNLNLAHLPGGRHPVLARAMEALIGAVMLDGGLGGVLKLVERLFSERDIEDAGHPKSMLQEWLQARNLKLPEYSEITRRGAVHAPEFGVECVLENPRGRFQGEGHSLKQAETEAARKALAYVGGLADQ